MRRIASGPPAMLCSPGRGALEAHVRFQTSRQGRPKTTDAALHHLHRGDEVGDHDAVRPSPASSRHLSQPRQGTGVLCLRGEVRLGVRLVRRVVRVRSRRAPLPTRSEHRLHQDPIRDRRLEPDDGGSVRRSEAPLHHAPPAQAHRVPCQPYPAQTQGNRPDRQPPSLPRARRGLSPVSLMVSAYATQLDAYAQARAADNLHWLTLEDLTSDPETTLATVWRFLDLEPPEPVEEIEARNASENRRELHPVWGRITRNRQLLLAAKALLPPRARDRIKSLFDRKVTAEGRFSLTEEESAALTILLDGEMARLRREYGVDTKGLWGL